MDAEVNFLNVPTLKKSPSTIRHKYAISNHNVGEIKIKFAKRCKSKIFLDKEMCKLWNFFSILL